MISLVSHAAGAHRKFRRRGNFLTRAADLAGLWIDRAHQRRMLRTLDDRALRDLGLSPGEVEREARKAFWKA